MDTSRHTLARRDFLKAALPLFYIGRSAAQAPAPPNILLVLMDQWRYPCWFPARDQLDQLLPNSARLRNGSVSFGRHYAAAAACTPSRSCLLTGLYTHQTGVLGTGAEDNPFTLDPAFPTYGGMLRRYGYQSNWIGKWHLSHGENLEPYGFANWSGPDPIGMPADGVRYDAGIVDQFRTWYSNSASQGPWCTTVSLVNPHDIAFYPRSVDAETMGANAPKVFRSAAANFETPEQLEAAMKPKLQRAFQETMVGFQGAMPLRGPQAQTAFARLLDWYLYCQQLADAHLGQILDTLDSNPDAAANTVVVFTSDHGEYGGSHGLRNKGGAAYEEAIRVPLYIRDPRGVLAANPEALRTQIFSHADIAPLFLTIATGGNGWRTEPDFAHISTRADLCAVLQDPAAPGRDHAIHTTDEPAYDSLNHSSLPRYTPDHVIALAGAEEKFCSYSLWPENSIDVQDEGMELEGYDYTTKNGAMELDNIAPQRPEWAAASLDTLRQRYLNQELRQPLPESMQEAQANAFAKYYAYMNDTVLPSR